MRKYYCDSCEIEKESVNVLSVPCHLYSFKGKAGYSDMDGNPVSVRMDEVDLCNSCLNTAYTAALDSLGLPDKGVEQ